MYFFARSVLERELDEFLFEGREGLLPLTLGLTLLFHASFL
jgi:hypothetical protein